MNKKNSVADQLRSLLLNAKFKAGDRLPPEPQLAAAFRVGRNTIREAVAQLVTERLLEIRPGIGTIVRDWLSNASLDAFSMVLELKRGTPRGRELLLQLLWPRRGLYAQLVPLLISGKPDLATLDTVVDAIRRGDHGSYYWNDLPALLSSEETVLTHLACATGNLPATLFASSISRILHALLPCDDEPVELADALPRFELLTRLIESRDATALTALLDELCRLREQTYLDLLHTPEATPPEPPPP